jgi:hypothetical protein
MGTFGNIHSVREIFNHIYENTLGAMYVKAQEPVIVSSTLTRPANTNTLDRYDIHGANPAANLIFLSVVGKDAGAGTIVKARLTINSATVAGASFRLVLFHTVPTALADEAQYALLYADYSKKIGHIDFTLQTAGTGSDSAFGSADVSLDFVLPSGTTIWGQAYCDSAAYVTKSGGILKAELFIVRQ